MELKDHRTNICHDHQHAPSSPSFSYHSHRHILSNSKSPGKIQIQNKSEGIILSKIPNNWLVVLFKQCFSRDVLWERCAMTIQLFETNKPECYLLI